MRYTIVLSVDELQGKKPEDLPIPTRQEESNFFSYFGIAMSTWQALEDWLFQVYVQAIGLPESRQLSAAFYAVPSFRVRLDMIHSTLGVCDLSDDLKESWARLYKQAKDKSTRRNRIAHAIVVFDPNERSHQGRLYLRPSMTNGNRPELRAFPAPHKDRVGVKELNEMITSFESLLNDVQDFHHALVQYLHPIPD